MTRKPAIKGLVDYNHVRMNSVCQTCDNPVSKLTTTYLTDADIGHRTPMRLS